MDTFKETSYQYKLLYYIGLDPSVRTVKYTAYVAITNILTLLHTNAMAMHLLKSRTLGEVCSSIFFTTIFILLMIKLRLVHHFASKLPLWTDITKELDKRCVTEGQMKSFRRSTNFTKKMFYVFLGEIILTYVLECGVRIYELIEGRLRTCPPIWLPFDFQSNDSAFWIIPIFQVLLNSFHISQALVGDCFGPTAMSVYVGHMNTLGYNISRIGYSTKANGGDHLDDLKQCIRDHKLGLQLLKMIQDSTSLLYFSQFFLLAISQGSIAVYFVKSAEKDMFIPFMFLGGSFELFLPCYFGSMLETSGENLSTALYKCNWLDQDMQFKRTLVIFMHRVQRVDNLKAGNFFDVNLETFVKFQRTAYSVFALLNNV